MKTLFKLFFVMFLASSAFGQGATCQSGYVCNGAETANGDAVILYPPQDAATVVVNISGTWSGTISFKGSNGGVYVANTCTSQSAATTATTTTANDQWRCPVAGLTSFEAVSTASMTGSATVTVTASKGSPSLGGGGGSGTGFPVTTTVQVTSPGEINFATGSTLNLASGSTFSCAGTGCPAKTDLSNLANPTAMQAGQQLQTADTGNPTLTSSANLWTSNVNFTAPQFNGALNGNAGTATNARNAEQPVTNVTDPAWGVSASNTAAQNQTAFAAIAAAVNAGTTPPRLFIPQGTYNILSTGGTGMGHYLVPVQIECETPYSTILNQSGVGDLIILDYTNYTTSLYPPVATFENCQLQNDGESIDGVVGAVGAHVSFQGNHLHNFSGTAFTLTQVTSISGGNIVYAGTFSYCASNACVGQNVNVTGFTNAGNDVIYAPVTASSATALTVTASTGVLETHAGVATNEPFPYHALGGGESHVDFNYGWTDDGGANHNFIYLGGSSGNEGGLSHNYFACTISTIDANSTPCGYGIWVNAGPGMLIEHNNISGPVPDVLMTQVQSAAITLDSNYLECIGALMIPCVQYGISGSTQVSNDNLVNNLFYFLHAGATAYAFGPANPSSYLENSTITGNTTRSTSTVINDASNSTYTNHIYGNGGPWSAYTTNTTNSTPGGGIGIGMPLPSGYQLAINNEQHGYQACGELQSTANNTGQSFFTDAGDYGMSLKHNTDCAGNFLNTAASPNQTRAVSMNFGDYAQSDIYTLGNYPSGTYAARLLIDYSANIGIGGSMTTSVTGAGLTVQTGSNNHLIAHGTAPTTSSTGCAVGSASNDVAGIINLTTGATACVVAFNSAMNNPVVTLTPTTATILPYLSAVSTSGFTVTVSATSGSVYFAVMDVK